jgi:hypothetical protein
MIPEDGWWQGVEKGKFLLVSVQPASLVVRMRGATIRLQYSMGFYHYNITQQNAANTRRVSLATVIVVFARRVTLLSPLSANTRFLSTIKA